MAESFEKALAQPHVDPPGAGSAGHGVTNQVAVVNAIISNARRHARPDSDLLGCAH